VAARLQPGAAPQLAWKPQPGTVRSLGRSLVMIGPARGAGQVLVSILVPYTCSRLIGRLANIKYFLIVGVPFSLTVAFVITRPLEVDLWHQLVEPLALATILCLVGSRMVGNARDTSSPDNSHLAWLAAFLRVILVYQATGLLLWFHSLAALGLIFAIIGRAPISTEGTWVRFVSDAGPQGMVWQVFGWPVTVLACCG